VPPIEEIDIMTPDNRPANPVSIQHNVNEQRFECTVEGHLCVATYQRQGQVMRMTHTGVHPSLRGQGIAAQLVEAALAYAQVNGLHIEPACSYVQAYMLRRP
jgi:uncharacterized protein